jgi:hypothetical protein
MSDIWTPGRPSGLTIVQQMMLIDRLVGTDADDAVVAADFGISVERLTRIMAEKGYERCPQCRNWAECCELIDGGEPCNCDDCREKEEKV